MNAYEIRLETLKLAKEIAGDNATSEEVLTITAQLNEFVAGGPGFLTPRQ